MSKKFFIIYGKEFVELIGANTSDQARSYFQSKHPHDIIVSFKLLEGRPKK